MFTVKTSWTAILLFIIIALIHTLFSVNFDPLNIIVNWQDMTQPLNPAMFLERSLYMWTSTFPWGMNSWLTAHLFYATPIYFFYSITDNIILSINIFWFFLHFFFLFSYYLLFSNIFKGKVLYWIIWSLLVYYSINTINILQFATVYVDYASYIWIPLLFFAFHKFAFQNKNIYILLFIFAEVLLFRPTSIFLISNLFIATYFLYAIYTYMRNRSWIIQIKRIFILWVTSLLVLLLPAFSLFLSAQRFIDSPNFKAYTSSWLSRVYQDGFALSQLLRLNWCGTCHREVGKEFPNLVFYQYSGIYNSSPFYILVSMIPILVIVSGLLYRREKGWKEYYIPIFLLVIVLLFFAKSINPPFAAFNEYFRQLPIFWIFFRSGAKYFMFFIIPLIVFLWLLLIQRNRLYIKLAWVYILSHALLIYILHSPVGTYWKTTLPDTYPSIVSEIDNLPELSNILLLPIANHRLDGQMYFRDGYAWSDRLYALTNAPIIYGFSVFWSSEGYKKYFTDISKWRNQVNDYDAIRKNMGKLWYSHILVEKNAISYPKIDITQPQATWELIYSEIIKNTSDWEMLYENNDFALFKWKDTFPVFRSENITIKKNNPTNYDLVINTNNTSTLSFLQSYHPDWKLYLEPYSEISCNSPTTFLKNQVQDISIRDRFSDTLQLAETYNVTECEPESTFYTWGELWRFQEVPVFEYTHKTLHNYANQWTIDSNYIKNNYDTTYYKENSDGSIDIRIQLYLKSQNYFYIWLMVSLITLMFTVLWILFFWIRDPNKKSKRNSRSRYTEVRSNK